MKYTAFAVTLFTALAYARTDLAGCTSSASGTRLLWWVPDTGEICHIPFCGMDPDTPITTSPGCPGYKGTATITPSYMPGWGPSGFTGSPTSSSPMAVMTGASSKMDSATVTMSTMTKASGSSTGTLTATTTPAAVLNTSTVSTSTSTGTAPVVKSSGTTKASNGTVTTGSTSASVSPSQVSASGAAVGFSGSNVLGTIVGVAAAAAALL